MKNDVAIEAEKWLVTYGSVLVDDGIQLEILNMSLDNVQNGVWTFLLFSCSLFLSFAYVWMSRFYDINVVSYSSQIIIRRPNECVCLLVCIWQNHWHIGATYCVKCHGNRISGIELVTSFWCFGVNTSKRPSYKNDHCGKSSNFHSIYPLNMPFYQTLSMRQLFINVYVCLQFNVFNSKQSSLVDYFEHVFVIINVFDSKKKYLKPSWH